MRWAILCIVAIALLGCMNQPTGNTISDPVTVGALMPLTGDFADYGEEEMNAITLFLEKHPQQILVEDSNSEPAQAIAGYNRMRLRHPQALLTIGSSIALALQPITNKDGMPVIAVGANPAIAQGLMIQNLPTADDYVTKLVAELERRNIEYVAIIYRNDDLGTSVRDAFLEQFEGETSAEAFEPGDTDFRTQLAKARATAPQTFYLIANGQQLGTLIRQTREQFGDILIAGTLEMNYPEVVDTAGDAHHNIIYTDLALTDENAQYKAFKHAYEERYGRKPSLDSVLAYNAMIMIDACADENALFSCLTTHTYDGLTGTLTIENNRVIYSDSMVVREIA